LEGQSIFLTVATQTPRNSLLGDVLPCPKTKFALINKKKQDNRKPNLLIIKSKF
jgi:hypothetical protein